MFKATKLGQSLLTLCTLLIVFSGNVYAKKEKKAAIELPKVVFQTSVGSYTMELYPDAAPITVKNFLRYVDEGFYVGTIFHRVIPNFMAQAGGMTYEFKRKDTHENIQNESDNELKNELAMVAMARSTDPDSASSQFYINLKHNDSLDYSKKNGPGYTVFGKVIDGFETIKKIEREPRGIYRSHPDAPNYHVIIEKVSRQK